ncbi:MULTISPECIES: ABC transporter permease [Pseudovibrio]|uniref:ABC transporter permease n=1 Tax=Stappiaceae TaxID=2821832 RepID=UPI0023654D5E|nr:MULTISPECIES: ABC transporter permease [Pseudovibrio]MDD7910406.1 ABC transporter permease [Pseudovibrio exalbescens]MDX5594121.1 ABC transporter permease [Pseudovibrio sp. SPO723]
MDLQVQTDAPLLEVVSAGDGQAVKVSGRWTILTANIAETLMQGLPAKCSLRHVIIDMGNVKQLDTAGAWLLHRMRADLEFAGRFVELQNVDSRYYELFAEIEKHNPRVPPTKRPRPSLVALFERTGELTVEVYRDALAICHILGSLAMVIAWAVTSPRRMRAISIAVQFDKSCIGAVPIVMLMSFLIGAIIAQQGGFYLKQFGADIFVVDLAGILVLREIGVILTAIMVAGRSGSAFTAELGSMKMREEIDALNVIGLRVTEVLILPRLLALMLSLPVLVFLANIAALFGAGLVCWWYLGIPPAAFLTQLQIAIDVETLMVGVVKAPFMALIIGLIACVEGMKVSGSAESLGLHTTMSVVKAIFLVIVVDGVFAMFFASIGI